MVTQVVTNTTETIENGENKELEAATMVNEFIDSPSDFASLPKKRLTRPGLEPGITESKSVVLPITLSGFVAEILGLDQWVSKG